jgi:hypothetical protein
MSTTLCTAVDRYTQKRPAVEIGTTAITATD